MDLKITCDRCKCVVDHVCNSDLRRAAIDLYMMTLEGDYKAQLKKSPGYSKGDEHMPFYSETFLYGLLGKSNARGVLSTVDHLVRSAGLDPDKLADEASRELVIRKVQLTYDEAQDTLVLKYRGRRVTANKARKGGICLLMGGAKEIVGLQIQKASSFSEIPEILWLSDAFRVWKQKMWKEPSDV
jgi:hypothetical protein